MTPDPDDALDDALLLSAARGGDRQAFGMLFDRHARPVFWQAHRLVGNADDAQDITQETFLVLWRRRTAVHLVDRSALPWLLVTARHLASNARRRQGRTAALTLVEDRPDTAEHGPEARAANQWVRDEIDEALAGLSDLDRAVFEACVTDDLTYEQAAEKLGISHATVRNRLSRTRRRLRQDLADVRKES